MIGSTSKRTIRVNQYLPCSRYMADTPHYMILAGYPLRGVIIVCVICMKHRIIIFTIIIISLGQLLLSFRFVK